MFSNPLTGIRGRGGSPDGKFLYYTSGNAESDIWLLDLTTAKQTLNPNPQGDICGAKAQRVGKGDMLNVLSSMCTAPPLFNVEHIALANARAFAPDGQAGPPIQSLGSALRPICVIMCF